MRRRAALTTVAVTAAGLVSAPVAAGAPARHAVRSPDGRLRAQVTVTGRTPHLTVTRSGRAVLRADLGTLRALPAGRATGVRATVSRVRGTYETTAGKRREHTVDANRLTLRLAGRAKLELAASNDGVAFRQTGFEDPTVSYNPLPGSTGYLQRFRSNYEADYLRTPVRKAGGRIGYPALLSSRAGTSILLTETGLAHGAPGEHLTATRRRPGVLRTETADGERTPRRTSWRVAVIGSLADVVQSDLPEDFAAPSRLADTSWIRPGRVAWSWWSEGDVAGLDQQRRYVDFAADAGFEYVLVDAHWDPAWVPELVEYAARRNVRIILWIDHKDIAHPAQRAAVLDQWAAWGVAGVKADFFHRDTGAALRIMDDIAADAAARHLLVDFHGCTIPRGTQRTWPNVMTSEGVRGAEYMKNGDPDVPALNVTLAFTRNVVGSMDYTPVAFDAKNPASTISAMLAQSIVFESGLQHYAANPASYRSRPVALELLRQVPAVWDDVRLLAGTPRTSVTLARRAGEQWFVGSLSAAKAHTEIVTLDMLDPGRAYTARIYADDGRDDIAVHALTVSRGIALSVPVAADGGFSIVISPAA